ncbi:MAG: putative endopeptidase, partial [Acidobacteriaceae bacterium]|nr:putative endopeptidase [Acidobacteriaceae bacterium]
MNARITLSFSLLWFVVGLLPASAQKSLKAFNPNLMDTTADPCVNFFQYSCGGYLKQTPIPADEASYGQFDELNDQNQLVLKAILEKAAAGGAGRTANEQKIGDYYATCVNVEAVDSTGLKPLQPLLDRIAALKS